MLYNEASDLVAVIFLNYVLPTFNAILIAGITITTAKIRLSEGLSLIWCYFFPAQIILNWIQFYRQPSFIPVSSEPIPALITKTNDLIQRDISITMPDQTVIKYKECYKCDLYVVERSHHCPYCKKCVYILDHHCFFLGFCVGRTNMKYFITFCMWAAIGTAYGLYHIFDVMTFYRSISGKEAMFYFFPFTFAMWYVERAADFELFYIFLLDFGLGAMIICIFLTSMGLYSTLNNSTPYEDRKNIKADGSDRGLLDNFEEVFGRHGYFHFVFPMFPSKATRIPVGYRR